MMSLIFCTPLFYGNSAVNRLGIVMGGVNHPLIVIPKVDLHLVIDLLQRKLASEKA